MEAPSTPNRTPRPGASAGHAAMTSAASPFAQTDAESPRMRASTLAYGSRTRANHSVSSPPSAKAPSVPRQAPRTPQSQQLAVMPGPTTPTPASAGSAAPGPILAVPVTPTNPANGYRPAIDALADPPSVGNVLPVSTPRTPSQSSSRGHQRVPSSSQRSTSQSHHQGHLQGHQRVHSGQSVTHKRTPSSASYMRALDHVSSNSPSASAFPHAAPGASSAGAGGTPGAIGNPGPSPGPSANGLPSSHSHRKPQKRTSIGPWDFVKSIGAGSMGQVKLAVHRYTKQMAAVKIVPKAFTQKSRDGRESNEAKDARVIREAAIGRLLEHPNISKLYDVYSMTGHFYLVFEYISGGQMLDYIIAHGCVKENQARRFARSIASALEYCHHNSVVHRDLKIENILIADDGDIRLIDFGLSNLFRRDDLLRTFCGSLYFAAPELLNALPYVGPEIDVWSFGVVLYVLVCGKVPFEDKSMTVLHAKIKRGTVDYPQWLSSLCVDLLSRMLTVNSSERATLSEVMHHPWMMKGFDGPPESSIPRRFPLTIDSLDPQVIEEMESLGIGDAYTIDRSLRSILGSAEYQAALDNWYDRHEADLATSDENGLSASLHTDSRSTVVSPIDTRTPDPLNSFAPEISCYFLTRERLAQSRSIGYDDRRGQSSTTISQVATTPRLQQNGTADSKEATPTPQPPPVLRTPKQQSVPKTSLSSPEPDIKSGRLRSKTLGAAYDMPPPNVSLAPPVSEPPTLINTEEVPQPAYVSNIPQQAQVGLVTPMTAVKPIDLDGALSPRYRSPSRIVSQPVPQSNWQLQQQQQSSQPPVPQQQQQQQQPLSLFRRFSLRRKSASHGRAKSTSHAVPTNFESASKGQSDSSQSNLTGMPSIESPKPVFFRGIFSVQSTSTKPLREIRTEIIRVLTKKHIEYVEVWGGFACIARPQISLQQMMQGQQQFSSNQQHKQLQQPPQLLRTSSSSSSIYASHASHSNHSNHSSRSSGLGLAGPVNMTSTGGSGGNASDLSRTPSNYKSGHGELLVPPSPQTPPSTPKHRRKVSENGIVSPAGSVGGSTDSIDMEIGASDMLGESRQKSSIPIRFEISIVRVPIVSLHGIQFKKMTGNVWQYKNLAQEILEDLRI